MMLRKFYIKIIEKIEDVMEDNVRRNVRWVKQQVVSSVYQHVPRVTISCREEAPLHRG